jgi:hypothetical protein
VLFADTLSRRDGTNGPDPTALADRQDADVELRQPAGWSAFRPRDQGFDLAVVDGSSFFRHWSA